VTYAHEAAIKALKRRANDARELADKLDKYASALEDDREVSLTDRYCWAINEIENFMRNLDFNHLAKHAAELAKESSAR